MSIWGRSRLESEYQYRKLRSEEKPFLSFPPKNFFLLENIKIFITKENIKIFIAMKNIKDHSASPYMERWQLTQNMVMKK